MEKISYEKVNPYEAFPAVIECINLERFRQGGIVYHSNFIPSHWHRSIEFSYITSGSVILWINNQRQIKKQGEFIFINSGFVHKVETDCIEDCEVILCMLSYDFLKKVIPSIDTIHFNLEQPSKQMDKLQSIFLFFKEFRLNPQPYDEIKINSALYDLLHILMADFQDEHFDPTKQLINTRQHKILNYIENHYQENLTLKELAAIIPMSESHLSRLFHEYFGINFKSYLTQLRLFFALEQITNTNKSIQSIAQEQGFSNVKSLITSFHRMMGMTPYQYRLHQKRIKK